MFNADLIVYVANSYDAYDNMTFEKVVGVSPIHNQKNYSFATLKLFEKVFRIISGKIFKAPSVVQKKIFCAGFKDLNYLAEKAHIPLIIYLHPVIEELKTKKYISDGLQIVKFYNQTNKVVLSGLNNDNKQIYYNDDIHYNKNGQSYLAHKLLPTIISQLKINNN